MNNSASIQANATSANVRLSKAAASLLGRDSIAAPHNTISDVVHAAKLR